MNQRVSSVDGKTYAIGFEMRLPIAWNGRFFYQANGGLDGNVVTATGEIGGGGPTNDALNMGFAVISSDAGHSSAQNPLFGLDPQARIDYGYNAVATLTPMAKQVIKLAYGKAPDRSYFDGCSNGGRHALVAAARSSAEYDGIIAGDPGFHLPKAADRRNVERAAIRESGDRDDLERPARYHDRLHRGGTPNGGVENTSQMRCARRRDRRPHSGYQGMPGKFQPCYRRPDLHEQRPRRQVSDERAERRDRQCVLRRAQQRGHGAVCELPVRRRTRPGLVGMEAGQLDHARSRPRPPSRSPRRRKALPC